MKDNLIQFPGTTAGDLDEADDFCGAAGFMFESGPSRSTLPESDADSMELYNFEQQVMDRLHSALSIDGQEEASISFHEPEALREEFKRVLLKVLARSKKAAHRSRHVLTVSHPEMTVEEQVPFLKETSETPRITLRPATNEELEMMYSLRTTFPELLDTRNAINSVKQESPSPYFF